MKKIALLLSFAMLFTLGNAAMSEANTEVILNAKQVTSAVDIESAIDTVTNNGTRSGIVTLDSSKGDFTYSSEDRSINIYYSNITIRSKNGAALTNCADGVYFDNTAANNIIIEGIRFNCEVTGVNAWGAGTHKNVTIKNNTFITGSLAIEAQGADGWDIIGNYAISNGTVIHLLKAVETKITRNSLVNKTQGIGIFLEQSNANSMSQNMLVNGWQGVLIGSGSSNNRVSDNKIYLIQQAGISFEGNNEYNSVLANKVSCQPGTECEIVNVDNPPLSSTNKVRGNKIIHQ